MPLYATPELSKYEHNHAGPPDSLPNLPSPALKPSQKPLPEIPPISPFAHRVDLVATSAYTELSSLQLEGARNVELVWPVNTPEDGATTVEMAATALRPLSLESLKLECCVHSSVSVLLESVAISRTLTHLSVVECLVESVEEAMRTLGACESLRSLTWCGFTTDVAIYELVAGGSALEALELSSYDDADLTDDAVLAIASFCPCLTRLVLAIGSDAGVDGLDGESMSGLVVDGQKSADTDTDADMMLPRALSGLTDEMFYLLAGQRAGVPGCPRLVSLDLGSSLPSSSATAAAEQPGVTDASVRLLSEGGLPALTELGLGACVAVSAAAIATLAAARPSVHVATPPTLLPLREPLDDHPAAWPSL